MKSAKTAEETQNNLQKAFTNAKYSPELALTDTIWCAIIAREKRSLRLKLWSYACIGILSLIALFPVITTLSQQFTQSGFSEYLSVGFSDVGSIAPYWKEFGLTLVDSLPATSLILSLSLVCVFLVSMRRAAHSFRTPLVTA